MNMLDNHERALIRAVLYPVQFEARPEDGIGRVVSTVISRKALDATPTQYASAIRSALASNEQVSRLIPQDHGERAVRRYLQKLLGKVTASPPTTALSKRPVPKPVTTRQLAHALAQQHELTKKQSTEMLEDLVAAITKHLKKGERVRIAGLGILQVRKRAARMGRNPATGEAIKIKASKKVAFRAAKDIKEAI